MATKVQIRYPKGKISAVVNKQLSSIIDTDELAEVVGRPLIERIKFEAKRGTPLNNAGSFKPLAKSTIENRIELAKYNKTATVYKENRSNLSFTGQLLDSLQFRRIKSDGKSLKILVFFGGDREMYNIGPKTKATATERNRTNDSLAATLAEIGFRVFSKDGIEKKTALMNRITNAIRSYIRKKLR